MRGKLFIAIAFFPLARITPADAGKTARRGGRMFRKEDHPRGCGENIIPHSNVTLLIGSPPRMRGKLPPAPMKSLRNRITPADAGKTKFCKKFTINHKDHPRGCGENKKQEQ